MSMRKRPPEARAHRLERLRRQGGGPSPQIEAAARNASLDCGWGRLLFAHTFDSTDALVETLRAEGPDRRDIAFYVPEPQVALALAPQEVFLDPSVTYRLDLASYRPARQRRQTFSVRRLATEQDAQAVNRIYAERNMVPVDPAFFWRNRDARKLTVLVVEDAETGEILGSAMGVDHALAFDDPDRGSSLWCLAVSPKAPHAGIGEALVRRLAEYYKARGASYLDLSVMHDNTQAIALYEKLGFSKVSVYALKRKNVINERLFTGETDEGLNPYAGIIVAEARRRGIAVDIIDSEAGLFSLSFGGRSVRCREALSELTSAVAMSICDDKRLTHRIVAEAGVEVAEQIEATDDEASIADFLARHGKVVVKPARGEQGRGISAGLATTQEVLDAVERAREVCETVLIERFFEGEDLRLVVIDFKVVAAALRRPARIVGNGTSTVRELIEVQSRRRAAATGGESQIPMDAETERCLANEGLTYDSVLDAGQEVVVRKTANLHTGGTIEDVTGIVHPRLTETAIRAARAIDIPVTGIDLMVKSPQEPDHIFIEANERPGLANHEPQPTAERFLDLLFPLSMPTSVRTASKRLKK